MKKKSKGGKRPGAGRPPLSDAKENVPLRVAKSDIKKWGGKAELKKKLYDFIAFPSQFDSVSVLGFPIKNELKDLTPAATKEVKTVKIKDLASAAPLSDQDQLKITANPDTSALRRLTILKEIEAIQAEKIPKERDTVFGRKSWQLDQHKRIQELQNKLK